MEAPTLPIPMEHDGLLSNSVTIPGPAYEAHPVTTTQDAITGPILGGNGALPSRTGVSSRRRSSINSGGTRIFCPVVGCPESLTSSNRYFRNITSIKPHLNDHCTGYLSGVVPIEFLRSNDYSQCSVCDKIVHNHYNGSHPKCRPRTRKQERINALRTQVNPTNVP